MKYVTQKKGNPLASLFGRENFEPWVNNEINAWLDDYASQFPEKGLNPKSFTYSVEMTPSGRANITVHTSLGEIRFGARPPKIEKNK